MQRWRAPPLDGWRVAEVEVPVSGRGMGSDERKKRMDRGMLLRKKKRKRVGFHFQ